MFTDSFIVERKAGGPSGPGLALMAVVCLAVGSCAQPPPSESKALFERPLSQQILNTEPVRGATKPLLFIADDTTAKCSSCHEGSFPGGMQEQALADQHSDIKFNHGMNLRCLNCHDEKDPDSYVAHDGSPIPSDKPTLLCAKCHGPTYEDWKIGIHGRINGHWSSRYGEQKRLDCIQCHDPHFPIFKTMKPDPPARLTRFEPRPPKGLDLSLGPLPSSGAQPDASANTPAGAENKEKAADGQ